MAKQRYIVTMIEGAGESDAIKAMSIRKQDLKDAVSVMETDDFREDIDTLGVAELGIFLKSMTAKDADAVRANKQVLEVTEDIEVFALGADCGCGGGTDYYGEDDGGYEAGYDQALNDLGYGDGDEWDGADDALLTPSPFPPRPIPRPFPPRPFPPRPPLRPFPPVRPCCPPGFRKVCLPIRTPRPPRQPIPWNISMVKADQAWRRVTGRGVKVAIIDTGIDNNHPDLIVQGGASFVANVSDWDDDHSHGTHCAGIVAARNNASGIVGVAPDADLYAVKVLSASGSGSLSWILAGMGWCLRNGIQVASMSLGSNVNDPNAPCISAYQTAAHRLEQAGCIVVAAAGNAGRLSNPWVGNPARCPGFMAVAAVDRNSNKADFSSSGPASLGPLRGVEISAPGVSINSTVPGGGFGLKSGTSMACPHVSGAAALLVQQRPTWTPAQIRSRLKATARDLGAPGDDPETGAGLLDCLAAVS